MSGRVTSRTFSSDCDIPSITTWLINTWYILVLPFQNAWGSWIEQGGAGPETSDCRSWFNRSWFDKSLLVSLGQLFCCIRRSLELVSIIVFNIITNFFIQYFKIDISNIYSDLSFCRKSSIDVIIASCLASFDFYFNKNINLSMQSFSQI